MPSLGTARPPTGRAAHRARRSYLPLLWATGAVAALVLVLGVSGTLSAWTSAAITNQTNTVATANALILKEAGFDGTAAHTAQTCYSSTGAGNSYTCTNIDKYGGATAPLSPGQSRTTTATFTNVGSATGASFKLVGGACSQTASTTTPTPTNLCTTAGELTVAISCSDGATFGTAWSDFGYAAGAPSGIGTLTHTASLAPGASWTCQFTVALNASASVLDQGVIVTQSLAWTLA